MSHNPYITYYVNQAGSGIGGFAGTRFQKGEGIGDFFSSIYSRGILPLLKYLGPKLFNTGADLTSDALEGRNIIESLKNRGKALGKTLLNDAGERAMKFAQTGKGKRRIGRKRRRGQKRKNTTKSNKRRRITKKPTRKFQTIF